MTPESPPAHRAYRRLRVPPFYPVPIRTRRDGWTVQRQADFIGMLAETGSVLGACEAVGMSRKSAYRLRALPGAESFAAAWQACPERTRGSGGFASARRQFGTRKATVFIRQGDTSGRKATVLPPKATVSSPKATVSANFSAEPSHRRQPPRWLRHSARPIRA